MAEAVMTEVTGMPTSVNANLCADIQLHQSEYCVRCVKASCDKEEHLDISTVTAISTTTAGTCICNTSLIANASAKPPVPCRCMIVGP